jgi:hypothetical protein
LIFKVQRIIVLLLSLIVITISFFEQLDKLAGVSIFFVNSITVAVLGYFHGTTTKNEIGKTEISLAIWDELTVIGREHPEVRAKFGAIERIIFTTREPTSWEDVERSGISSSRSSDKSVRTNGSAAHNASGSASTKGAATPQTEEISASRYSVEQQRVEGA